MTPFLKSIPRRRRFLVVVPVLALLVWALLPPTRLNSPTTLFGAIKGSSIKSSDSILRYIDPLIGTVNGGRQQASTESACATFD